MLTIRNNKQHLGTVQSQRVVRKKQSHPSRWDPRSFLQIIGVRINSCCVSNVKLFVSHSKNQKYKQHILHPKKSEVTESPWLIWSPKSKRLTISHNWTPKQFYPRYLLFCRLEPGQELCEYQSYEWVASLTLVIWCIFPLSSDFFFFIWWASPSEVWFPHSLWWRIFLSFSKFFCQVFLGHPSYLGHAKSPWCSV